MNEGPLSPPEKARYTLHGVIVLGGVLAMASVVALAAGKGRPGWGEAVAFAAAISGAGAVGGWLAACRQAADPAAAVAHGLAAAALRLLPPLGALGWLSVRGGTLRNAGAGGLLVIFYLSLLATAILLHIMVSRPAPRRRSPD